MNQQVTRKTRPSLKIVSSSAARTLLLILAAFWLTATSLAQSQPTVKVASSTLGDILVGPNGMTLYTFANDQPDGSSCTGGCALNWPPLTVSGELVAPSGLPGELEAFTRQPDEETGEYKTQVTYNGQPLYYWSRDMAPGDVSGQGIGDLWFVAKP